MTRDELMRQTTRWVCVENHPLTLERQLFWGPERRPDVVARVRKRIWPGGPPRRLPSCPNIKGSLRFEDVEEAAHTWDEPFPNQHYYLSLNITPDDPDGDIPRLPQTCTPEGFTLRTLDEEPFAGTVEFETFTFPAWENSPQSEPENYTFEVVVGIHGWTRKWFRAPEGAPDTPANGFPTAREAMAWADEQLAEKGYVLDGHPPMPETLKQIRERGGSGWPRWA